LLRVITREEKWVILAQGSNKERNFNFSLIFLSCVNASEAEDYLKRVHSIYTLFGLRFNVGKIRDGIGREKRDIL